MARRSPVGVAPLTIMITDGRPTVRNVSSPNGHGGNTTTDGNGSQTSAAELAQAVLEADRLKDGTTSAGGSTHMFTIGVGSALNNATDVSRLKAISGNEALEGPDGNLGTADDFPFAEADYTLVQEFEELREILEDFVKELCARNNPDQAHRPDRRHPATLLAR